MPINDFHESQPAADWKFQIINLHTEAFLPVKLSAGLVYANALVRSSCSYSIMHDQMHIAIH